MIAARSGNDVAMRNLMVCYRGPGSVVSKEDLATTLHAHKVANDKGKTEPREYAIRHRAFEEKNYYERTIGTKTYRFKKQTT